jgi:hypothetical protein
MHASGEESKKKEAAEERPDCCGAKPKSITGVMQGG